MSNYSVSLVGPAPWGFRLQGGKDFNMPLTISRLSDGGKAAQANVGIGDVVLSIDGISAEGMTHLEAQNKIKTCSGKLNMTRSSDPDLIHGEEPKEVVKPVPIASAVAPKITSTANMAYNKAPRPFGAVSSSKVTSIPSPSSAFTPAPVTASSRASPPPLATVSPPPFAASGLHANAKSSADQRSPALSAAKTAVNIPRQPTYNTSLNAFSNENAQEVAEGQRRGFKENQGDNKQQNGPPRKHILYTTTEFYHPPTHSDASKKRLIEDTEDWHPRTGTTQSRSFRILAQITGTEHCKWLFGIAILFLNSDSLEPTQPVVYTAATVKSMPQSPENNDARPAAAKIASPMGFKSTGSHNAVKPSDWQPSSQAAPAGGWISNNVSKSGATAPSAKSMSQPPLTEPDTLVQRAEHIPAGKRTPMCAHCDQVIRGPFLVALGKSWHPEEFNCAHCKTSMAYIGFVEEKGALYCEGCYEKFFAPNCSRCQRKILGEVINALKQTWHVSCFVCVACHNPIRNNVFHLEDGDPYCETDYYALFGTMCHGCEFPIEAGDRFLEALGHTWHDTCFVCSVCCDSLEGQTFFSKKDKPLCKKHAHSVNF
uniref:PDZ and LIM domain 5 n=1 Tax=Sphenodon punctatus TaxID=8508 RepID=A0A8D0GFM0_SPHPU